MVLQDDNKRIALKETLEALQDREKDLETKKSKKVELEDKTWKIIMQLY